MSNPIPLKPVRLWHGGDYNPDQWSKEIREDDARLMQLSHVNIASVAIFAWSQLEPEPGKYTWDWLDETFERLHRSGVSIALATPSAAHPRWLTQQHPEVMEVNDQGQRVQHGIRQRFCPSSPVFREHVDRINRAMAERYGKHPALVLWHVSNEYGAPRCYCDLCAGGFRTWLKDRYGNIDVLNQQWWSTFWSQRFNTFEQIPAPIAQTGRSWQGLMLDWKRYQSCLLCEFFKFEAATLRKITPHIPITTNLMGHYGGLDYAKFADVMDVVSWDCYARVHGDPAGPAYTHAYMRGVKDQRPWLLMEQTPSATNWQENATLKPPGVAALWSWQAMAHGSDSSMYFQWRRSRGASEKMHGAVVEHAGTEKARVFQEIAALGADMSKVSGKVAGTRVAAAKIGILYDQECRWAFEGSGGPGHHKPYVETVGKHYKAIWRQNLPIDMVRMDADWSQYKLLVAPMLYMVKSGEYPKSGTPEQLRTRVDEGAKIEQFVKAGGTFVATYLSGYANENDYVYENGYPGPLRKIMGLWVDEMDNSKPGEQTNRIMPVKRGLTGMKRSYTCDEYFDQIVLEGAESLATYGKNWYAGKPCVTRNRFGRGTAYYLGCAADDNFLKDFYAAAAKELGLESLLKPVAGVEVLERCAKERRLLFILNHNGVKKDVPMGAVSGVDLLSGEKITKKAKLAPYGVRIVEVAGGGVKAKKKG
jgi:beta-galactosidase